jgi:hypothetical protein
VRAAPLAYRPRQPDADVLHRLVRDHFETLRARARGGRDDEGLPAFVEREFREFLTCGRLAAGFARFRCRACGTDRLVAFSCKGRGFCPSCGGRRMTERAAHLVDHVFPAVPIRQWVLTLPVRLRYALAFDHAACRDVAAAFLGAVFAWLRSRARCHGVSNGQTGAVVIVQRFGGALNLNVHLHALVLDGVFAPDGAGGTRFWSLDRRAVVAADLAALLAVVRRRVLRRLESRGLAGADDAPDQWADTEPVLAGLAAASVAGVAASGRRRGAPVRRWGDALDRSEPAPPGRWQARIEGFDLHAGLIVPARARDRLEQLCRYALRPPVGQHRLQEMSDGKIALELRHRWTDGTTHLVFDPVELLERLAALVPRPRVNLVLYYGVLAPRAVWRRAVVPGAAPDAAGRRAPRRPNPTWAELMRRGFGFDVLACARCAGRMTLVALIHSRAVIERILRHLGEPIDLPRFGPSRDPPVPWLVQPDDVQE